MKLNVLLLFALMLLFNVCSPAQNGNKQSNDSTEIVFNEVDHNFGTIKYKGDATFEFEFKNTGKTPLIIKNVQPSCGCTVANFDAQPVLPKGKGKVTVKFDTERVGPFTKSIKVYANAKNSPIDLTIRGEVKSAEQK